MKRAVILFMLVCITFVFAQAQRGDHKRKNLTAEERAQKLTEWMKKEISLTTEQESKVFAINLKYAKQIDQTRASEASKETRGQDVKKINQSRREELKTVLTNEQVAKLQEKRKQRHNKSKDKEYEEI